MAPNKKNEPTSREILKNYRDRIVRLEEQKQEISADIKEILAEAKSTGFDSKALRAIVKESMMDVGARAARRETEALIDVYRATLGMLDGTGLGDAARKRFEDAARDKNPDQTDIEDFTKDEAAPATEETTEENASTNQDAHQRGIDDYTVGKKILENPYHSGDPRRAEWDSGFCQASGSDGMEIPDAWRRKPKKADAEREPA
jgi:uncharacterized protein (UPF0335 family)